METTASDINVFWQPGCSSCVRTKEFLTKLGIPFNSVNVLGNKAGLQELKRLGARSVPIVSRGDTFTYAQSIEDVARFLDRMDAVSNWLPPEQLFAKWDRILDVAFTITPLIPDEIIRTEVFAGRARTYLDLSYHIVQIVDAFLQTVEEGLEDWTTIANIEAPDRIQTKDDILREGWALKARLDRWWENLEDKSCTQTLKMFYGEHPLHQFLERSTWHCAQHTRQLIALLSEKGIDLPKTLTEDDYAGLPMPKGVWE
jgi:glutaredoxin